ncbi:Nuclear speckle splicing regulatory protein 1-like [Oopsacas minuta]|uniref:Nuclear speckle splicing regulatory protein 1-like n=1 Tax=Oopsacas minuta TaxID=111878 RepID=A0AAV7K182_9METZ|nr:Nuclear speckle splicing regulatory protein 1-like [Oopsacas minuta]
MIGGSSKGYGLILKKNSQTNTGLSKPSIFASDSDSDDNPQAKFNIESLQAKYASKANKQIKHFENEDSDIYQYDEVYDAMEVSRLRRIRNVQEKSKKSKYVSLIKDMSEERERERDRRLERKYISERETEGDLYKDKDSYTTPGYRKYLQERLVDDEKERVREEQEAKLDVTKQKDLSLFYSHLLTDNVAMGGTSSGGNEPKGTVSETQNTSPKETDTNTTSDVITTELSDKNELEENLTEHPTEIEKELVIEDKIDIFAKRTTEEMRLAALERYLERKRKRMNALVMK